ncbi:MAG: YkgJ family cysteine cluster protein [Candidatus Thiodiazotropha sp. (ex Rostrolucina anterorostrata)]|nr:YkgJ family cysteine cluster protein [Candidatus Thiodiazotropha sp. (ex Rostrolucina anterorostrata)]
MPIQVKVLPDSEITCASCEACCCSLEVILFTDNGVPNHFTETNIWGGRSMWRLDDGWCSALDRNTMMCLIYEQRPQICREFELGAHECIAERTAKLRHIMSIVME